MDVLRARALTDLLLNQDSRPPGRRGTAPGDAGADHPAGPYWAPGSGVGRATIPAGFASRHLTIPLTTLLGLADRPGLLDGLGPVDPWQARDLAPGSAATPDHLVPDRHRHRGRAAGHACARPEPRRHARQRKRDRPPGPARPAPPAPGSPSPPPAPDHPADTGPGGSPPECPASGPGSSHRPDPHRRLRPPLPGQGPRPRRQAPPPDPIPARYLHRPHVRTTFRPRRFRAQRPPTTKAAARAFATPARSAGTTISSSKTPAGR